MLGAYAEYHAWAYRVLFEHLSSLDTDGTEPGGNESVWTRPCGLFARSVGGTLCHLLLSDVTWLRRIVSFYGKKLSDAHGRAGDLSRARESFRAIARALESVNNKLGSGAAPRLWADETGYRSTSECACPRCDAAKEISASVSISIPGPVSLGSAAVVDDGTAVLAGDIAELCESSQGRDRGDSRAAQLCEDPFDRRWEAVFVARGSEFVAEGCLSCAGAIASLASPGHPLVAAFGSRFEYENTRGESRDADLHDILTHLVNHGTHHRGQITAALTMMGHDYPPLDYLYFKVPGA